MRQERNARHKQDQDRLDRLGVNLGGLYAPAQAIANSPQFSRHLIEEKASVTQQTSMHVALVCLKSPETLDAATLEGLAVTLSQLVKLDIRLMVAIELGHYDESPRSSMADVKAALAEQGERLCQAIARHSTEGARYVSGTLETASPTSKQAKIALPPLLLEPLKRGVMTIVPSLAYAVGTGQVVEAGLEHTLIALTEELSGLQGASNESGQARQQQTSLDRIIVLNEAGGVPSKARQDGAHVFINLEQEYENIITELSDYAQAATNGSSAAYKQHETNLRMIQKCLALLPSASSALIISPQDAASSSRGTETDKASIGAGTRRQKNTLIHNLLTNKPIVSSSLPTARFSSANPENGQMVSTAAPTATLVKRGMPVAIIPAVDRVRAWQVPESGYSTLTLQDDARVDFARLVHLIEDSFRRKLDVQHYLDRIKGRIAGLIVAGEYEGGAILTWEQPPGTTDPSRLVPYLDKFAVLQSSQGAGGVADILFQSMVRSCFPDGVCWRSRKDNPVNKWYFERATSSWQIPGTQWTMFWTGEGIETNRERFQDYVSVCRDVVPSWADGRKPD